MFYRGRAEDAERYLLDQIAHLVESPPEQRDHAELVKLKINLENMPHAVYRRVLVPEDINMLQLHFIVQIAMGWEFAHLFQFCDKRSAPTIIASIPMEEDDLSFFGRTKESKADEIKLKDHFQLANEAKPFWYWYDFGDDWWHKITFQKPTKKDLKIFAGTHLCVDASGACPPEDVGGPWGYYDFLEIIHNKKHPEHQEMREWIGISSREKYDTEYVSLESINRNLAEYRKLPEWDITAGKYFK